MTKVRAKDARRRATLASDFPILGASCPEAQARLFDFSLDQGERRRIDKDGLQEAAEDLFSCVQRELRMRQSPLDDAAAIELSNGLFWAREALVYCLGSIPAKTREMLLADSAPLAICMGSRKIQPVQTARFGVLGVPVYCSGCRRIYEDSTRTTGGRMWRDWCPECTPSKTKHGRARERAHRKVVEQLN